jgi:hypothetical protein
MNNGIWNKERGPIGITGDTGPIGPSWDGQTPLSELTIQGSSRLITDDPINLIIHNTFSGSGWDPLHSWGILGFHSDDGSGSASAGLRSSIECISPTSTGSQGDLIFKTSDGTGNIEAMRITGTNRVVIGGTDNGDDLLQVGPDSDISASIGNGKIGFPAGANSNHFYIGHYDHFGNNSYGLLINPNGKTNINAPTGQVVSIRNNNIDLAIFSGSAIELLQPVVMTNLPTSDPVSAGALWNSSGTVMISAG